MHSRLKTTGRSRRAATPNSILGLPDTRLPRTVKWGAMTYSAWQCLALTDPTVGLGLLEVTEKMCGAGGKRACVPSTSMFQDVFTRRVPAEAAARLSPALLLRATSRHAVTVHRSGAGGRLKTAAAP